MNYIVMDLEWNQGNESAGNPELPFEIIEIGAIQLNSEKKMTDEFSELIRPVVYKEMHHITSKLIHMDMKELEKGKPFRQAAEEFLSWCGDDYIFCTWGPLDLTELQKNMIYHNMPPLADGPIAFLDVQKLFSIAFEDCKSRRSLEYAVDYLKLEKDIPFHRAFSDAYYTAKVLAHIQPEVEKMVSYDVFVTPKSREEEIHVVFDKYAKYISREFEDKMEAMEDKEVVSTRCYKCRKSLKKKIKWFTPNGKHYYCVSYCNEHGYMKGKIRIRKSENDKVYVVKTLKFIPEEEVVKIRARKEHASEIRRQKRRQERKADSSVRNKKR